MSYYKQAIKIYPNLLNHHTSQRETSLNYNPEAEPSITGETFTNSGGETALPCYDLVDDKLSAVVTTDSNGQTPNVTVDFDLSGNITANAIIVANHNFNTAGADISPEHTGTGMTIVTAWGGAQDVKGAFQCSSETLGGAGSVALVVTPTDGLLLINFSDVTDNNWELVIEENDTQFDADITIGEVIISQKWTSPHAPEVTSWNDSVEYGNVINQAAGGQNYGVGYHGERKGWSLSWQHLTQTQYDNLQQVFRITKGSRHPFFIDLGEHATNQYLHFVRLVGDSFSATPLAGGLFWNVSFQIKAEL